MFLMLFHLFGFCFEQVGLSILFKYFKFVHFTQKYDCFRLSLNKHISNYQTFSNIYFRVKHLYVIVVRAVVSVSIAMNYSLTVHTIQCDHGRVPLK